MGHVSIFHWWIFFFFFMFSSQGFIDILSAVASWWTKHMQWFWNCNLYINTNIFHGVSREYIFILVFIILLLLTVARIPFHNLLPVMTYIPHIFLSLSLICSLARSRSLSISFYLSKQTRDISVPVFPHRRCDSILFIRDCLTRHKIEIRQNNMIYLWTLSILFTCPKSLPQVAPSQSQNNLPHPSCYSLYTPHSIQPVIMVSVE